MSFSLNWPALLLFFIFLLKKPTPPTLPFPCLSDLMTKNKSLRARLAFLPRFLKLLALAFFLLAFANPSFKIAKEKPKTEQTSKEGVATYLVLDQSGSMAGKLPFLKQITRQYIEERPNDLLGLVSFARSASALTPLTLDHEEVLKQLASLSKVASREQEGTAIGYAIFKTANLISATREFAQEKEGYSMKDAALILVTDGVQDPNPLDIGNKFRTLSLEEAAAFAKEQNIKLYIINIEPKIAFESFAPHRRLLERVTELTDGKFFLASDPDALRKVYSEIDQLQKSALPDVSLSHFSKFYLYPYLLAFGMGLLFLSLLLETTYLRRAP